jgi:hypothetical protein
MGIEKLKRTFLVKKYYELKNSKGVVRAWKKEFPKISPPSHTTVLRTVSRFEATGSVHALPPIHKKIHEKREAAKNDLRSLVLENPTISIRKASCAVGMSYESVRTLLKEDLHLKPYKLHEFHELKGPDYAKRVKFAKWIRALPAGSLDFFICSDEAYFFLTEPINKQNNRFWSDSKPIGQIERPLHDQKVLTWCAMSAKKIYGPFFFENNVNQHNYLKMLQDFFWERHRKVQGYTKYYFQQDGARPHTANLVQNWLKSKFKDFFVDKTKWPPRSPDLNPCDFFLWGYLKSVVYNPLPKTIEELKQNIEREIKKINREMLESTFVNFRKRCDLVIAAHGGHIEDK